MDAIGRFLPRDLTAWVVLALVLISLLGIAWLFVPGNGLTARYYPNTGWTGTPALEVVERHHAADTFLARSAALFPDEAFSATWLGFLLVESAGSYTFTLASDDGSWLRVGGRVVVDNGGDHTVRGASAGVYLEPGLHPIEMKYFDAGGERALALQWAFEDERPRAIPVRMLFPTRGVYVARNLAYGYVVPLLASLVIMAVPIMLGMRHLARHLGEFADDRWTNAGLLAVLVLVVALAVPGVRWGLPYSLSWAPDELPLPDVLSGLRQAFSGGWHRAYPPVHYYLLGLLVAPLEVSEQAGLTSVLVGRTHTTLIVLFRTASVLMAVATTYLVYRCGFDLHRDRGAGVLGAVLAASMPIFVFYSGLANLEAPYLFWFTLALFFYVRFVRNPLGPDLLGFAVAATLAVCTKDQAYGFFMLPAAYALWLRYRSHAPPSLGALLTDRGVGKAAVGAAAAFVIAQNLVFNFQGFLWHVEYIVARSTYPPRFAQSVSGHLEMIGEAFRQLSWSMGWPSLVVGTAGFALILARQRRVGLGLMFFLLSYYIFFLAVVRYQFDRFFVGVCVILAVCGGRVLAGLLHARRGALAGRLACAAIVSFGVSYGAFVSVAMGSDSRYEAESWMASHVSRTEVIAYVGRRTYLPRFRHGAIRVLESWPYVERHQPDVLVINAAYSCRARPGTARRHFYERLADPDNGLYQLVLSHRANPWWPVRGPDAVFRAPCENDVTNLSKINPEIRIYRKVPAA
jgi:hypothetical protein